MYTLRLEQTTEGNGTHRVDISLEGPAAPRRAVTVYLAFALSDQDQERLRWYFEDYLQCPFDPAPALALNIERQIGDIGRELFEKIFCSDEDARYLWSLVRSHLSNTRIEITTDLSGAVTVPWELLRDSRTDAVIALRAAAFVRAHPNPAQPPALPPPSDNRLRILLVICRPGGRADVPFRSVAARLIRGLGECQDIQLDMLRPPTFAQLGRVLRQAQAEGKPYRIVHFDGHGVYQDARLPVAGPNPFLLGDSRPGEHGHLVFENDASAANSELVSGPALGNLLVETGVPLLVLNACRSAHANVASTLPGVEIAGHGLPSDDAHAQVRALGSMAQEVMDAGMVGVVAMRYNVYVVTAAQFVFDMYAALAQGHTLGEAVTLGRKNLSAQPHRDVGFGSVDLQDWPVPIVYEAIPLSLLPGQAVPAQSSVVLEVGNTGLPQEAPDTRLPPSPDIGFLGRDETLLAVDRAFDAHSVVLLHADAGSGKTTTAAEFARWYSLTGGVRGPVIYTSFEQHRPLERVLYVVGQAFGPILRQQGIHWLALEDAQRREVALQLLRQVPVLWVWDNVEPIRGFPTGTPSLWSAQEQQELADFLRAAVGTKARFLLTSRRDERSWLGDLPARVTLPPMPMLERQQFAQALAQKRGRRLDAAWRPLLDFSAGNPLTLLVTVSQALRDGFSTPGHIQDFVARLRAGEASLDAAAEEGRSRSLRAALSYGFEHGFSENERRQLALLHLFQGFVNMDVLYYMGQGHGNLPALHGLTWEAGVALLNRAEESGLLTSHGNGYYAMHPALPWFLKSLFDRYYPADAGEEDATNSAESRAFVTAMGYIALMYDKHHASGQHADAVFAMEEANLLRAWELAWKQKQWDMLLLLMAALETHYRLSQQPAEWARLVGAITPIFVNPATDTPVSDPDERWLIVTQYRMQVACQARRWSEAERLGRLHADWYRGRAAPLLQVAPETLEKRQRGLIQDLAASLERLGLVLNEQGNLECFPILTEAYRIFLHIGDTDGAVSIASAMSDIYTSESPLRDLLEAKRWCRRGLELNGGRRNEHALHLLARLGYIADAYALDAEKRFSVQRTNAIWQELLFHCIAARGFYIQAAALVPRWDTRKLALIYHQLGSVHNHMRDTTQGLAYCQEALRLRVLQKDVDGAGQTRFNMAKALVENSRFQDGRLYAEAALRDFTACGNQEGIHRTQWMLADIKNLIDHGPTYPMGDYVPFAGETRMKTPLTITLPADELELRDEIEQQLSTYLNIYESPSSFGVQEIKLILDFITDGTTIAAGSAALVKFLLDVKDRGKKLRIGKLGQPEAALENSDAASLNRLLNDDAEKTDTASNPPSASESTD